MADKLVEIDSLEALVIIDNELDVLSPVDPEKVVAYGNLGHIAMASPHVAHDRGGATKVLGMDRICCASWGLSVLLVSPSLHPRDFS
jgi:7,8-dihydropterin-6-yl-methyl-4-(beta-D-ribofuranosyl)aminobenzene 5'-phosphate synthase